MAGVTQKFSPRLKQETSPTLRLQSLSQPLPPVPCRLLGKQGLDAQQTLLLCQRQGANVEGGGEGADRFLLCRDIVFSKLPILVLSFVSNYTPE